MTRREFTGLSFHVERQREIRNAARFRCVGAMSVALLVSAPVSATLVQHYNQESWAIDAGRVTTIETATMPIGTFGWPEYDYWSSQGLSSVEPYPAQGVRVGDETQWGYSLADLWGVDPASSVLRCEDDAYLVEFAQPVHSFAMEIASIGYIGFWVHYTDGEAELQWFEDIVVDLVFDQLFFGVTSDRSIDRLYVDQGAIWPGHQPPSYVKSFAWGVPVPAPAVGSLVVSFGLASRCRRRRR